MQGITGNVGSFDTSVPPKRDIRKFARRCPSLRILRWAGRHGKGEWRIAAGSSSIHAKIDFVPIQLVEDDEAEQITLGSGADVEDFIVGKRRANTPHPGKQMPIEELDETTTAALPGPFEEGKVSGVIPRVDGKVFPRLKSNYSPVSTFVLDGPTEESITRRTTSKVCYEEDASCTSNVSHARPTVIFGQMSEVHTPTKNSKTKLEKSYASISDPKTIKTNGELEKARKETKMAVLGESNGRRGSNGQTCLTNQTALQLHMTTMKVKEKVVTKVPGRDDAYSGYTSVTGQGNPTIMSTTSGAAGRRNKKKVGYQVKTDESGKIAATTKTADGAKKSHHQSNERGKRK